MANLNQLKCPSCGAVLSLSIPDQIVVECPYCHQQVVNTNAYKSTKEEPRILEFKLEEKDIIKRLIDNLVSDETVPRDIFDKMSISSTKQYYVPMYIFEGTYRAPWSAKIPREVKKQRIDYKGKLEDYYETVYDYTSGEVANNFIINRFFHEELTRLNLDDCYIASIRLSPTSLPAFSQVNTSKDIVLITPSGDADYVWREYGLAEVRSIGSSHARHQARGYVTDWSVSCEMKESWMVYIPIWIIEYKYNGDSYTYINYAEEFDSVSKPYDNEIERPDITNINALPTTEQQETINNYNKRNGLLSNIRNLGCAGIICVGIIGCYKLGEKLSEQRYMGTPGWSDHKDDAENFGWTCFWVGIAFILLMSFVKFYFRDKAGIDSIEEDVNNRTKILQKEAEERLNRVLLEAEKYKRDTGVNFLKAFSGISSESGSDVLHNRHNKHYDLEIKGQSPESTLVKTKMCIKCGKEIAINHTFCKFCGSPQ